MHSRTILGFWALVFILVSCGETDSNSPQDPFSNTQNPAEIQSRAQVKIGTDVERNFTDQNSTTCLVNKVRGESVITFNDEESASSFSIRMSNMEMSKTLYELGSDNTRGNILVALGGDRRKTTYRLNTIQLGENSKTKSVCNITYQFSQTHMFGSYKCINLVNSEGLSVSSDGQWVCKMQENKDWSW